MNGYLAVALIVLAGALGVGFGDWRRARFGRTCYAAALVNHGVDERTAHAEAYWWYRPGDDELEVEAFYDDGGGEGASGVLAGGPPHPRQLETSRPGTQADHGREPANSASGIGEAVGQRPERDASPGPGHSRGYGPYLAAIGRDDPAGWYANLTAGEPAPEPGPDLEPAFVERVLLKEALEWRTIDAWHASFMEAFHRDVAAWDRFAARWAEEARWVLVDARSWPPPELAGVA